MRITQYIYHIYKKINRKMNYLLKIRNCITDSYILKYEFLNMLERWFV